MCNKEDIVLNDTEKEDIDNKYAGMLYGTGLLITGAGIIVGAITAINNAMAEGIIVAVGSFVLGFIMIGISEIISLLSNINRQFEKYWAENKKSISRTLETNNDKKTQDI